MYDVPIRAVAPFPGCAVALAGGDWQPRQETVVVINGVASVEVVSVLVLEARRFIDFFSSLSISCTTSVPTAAVSRREMRCQGAYRRRRSDAVKKPAATLTNKTQRSRRNANKSQTTRSSTKIQGPQLIPIRGMDQWALYNLLQASFRSGEYKVQVR